MKKSKISDTYELVFLSARLEIDARIRERIGELLRKEIDWKKVIEISGHQETLPLLYHNLSKLDVENLIPPHSFLTMKSCYYSLLKRNLSIEKEVLLILELTEKNALKFIPVKGFSLIQTLYNNPALRMMADVDVLIKIDELEGIKNVLVELGYKENTEEAGKKIRNDYRHMAIFSKSLSPTLSLGLEIHGLLACARPYEIRIPFLWERTYERAINGQRLHCLSKEDTFLSLLLHLRSHTRRLTLKFIVDIAELLNQSGRQLDWNYIKYLVRNNHIASTSYLFLYLAKELLDADVPTEILDEFRPGPIKSAVIHLSINRRNFFILEKWRGTVLRLLIFDRTMDLILYFWRVSFLERLFKKRVRIKITKEKPAINNNEKRKK